jgi:dihydroxyacetone kinase-like predicted kinase
MSNEEIKCPEGWQDVSYSDWIAFKKGKRAIERRKGGTMWAVCRVVSWGVHVTFAHRKTMQAAMEKAVNSVFSDEL